MNNLPAPFRYETRVFEAEIKDKGLVFERRNVPRYPKLPVRDQPFNQLCRPYLENKLVSLEKAGLNKKNC